MDALALLNGKTTKSAILRVLAADWPLSLKKIYFSLKKESNRTMTYQAVYKAVKELLGEGVLSRQGNQYLISPVFVEKSAEFIGKLAEAYEKNGLGGVGKLQELNFSSLNEAWDFLLSKLNTNFFGESKEAYIQLRRFFVFPLSKEDINRLKEFGLKKKVYVMCRGKSVVDKMAAGFLTSLGAHVITGIECARPTNVFVNGNCVISIYVLGKKERAELSNQYMAANSSETNRFKSLSDVFFKRVRVKFVINRDPEVLSDVLEQTKAILSKRPY